MTVADSTEIFNKPVVLKLDDGTLIPVESSLRYASGAIKDNLPGADPNAESFEFPMSNGVEKPEVDFLNTFMKTLEEKLPNELREKSEDRTYWVDNMGQHRDKLLPLSANVSNDVLIRAANLGDYLIITPFIHFCTYILADRSQGKPVSEIREMLNEIDDFTEEERRLIASCPELQ